jgi:hypothetical protein
MAEWLRLARTRKRPTPPPPSRTGPKRQGERHKRQPVTASLHSERQPKQPTQGSVANDSSPSVVGQQRGIHKACRPDPHAGKQASPSRLQAWFRGRYHGSLETSRLLPFGCAQGQPFLLLDGRRKFVMRRWRSETAWWLGGSGRFLSSPKPGAVKIPRLPRWRLASAGPSNSPNSSRDVERGLLHARFSLSSHSGRRG